MPVKDWDDWSLSERGKTDAARHREKIDKSIRKNVKDVIANESIITQKGDRKIRVPVRGLRDYKFIYGHDSDTPTGGIGQGEGNTGDVIARKIRQGIQRGKPGNEEGEGFLEVEVDIDYFLKIMFEDLGLPFIEEKIAASQLVPVGFKFDSISKIGIQPRLHKKKTLKETLKRIILFANEVMEETNCSEEDAIKALVQTSCDIEESIKIIKENKLDDSIDSNISIDNEDLRYKQIEEDFEVRSNAVIICVMDTSGSMTNNKKYLVRSFLFWFTEFLKKTYNNVEIRFISHTTNAELVEEAEFFHMGSEGGTVAAPAFQLAGYTLSSEYPVNAWNRYICYASDGQLWDCDDTIKSINSILQDGINMIMYLEVEDGEYEYGETLLKALVKKFEFVQKIIRTSKFYKNQTDRIYMSQIKDKEDVWESLKFFLFANEAESGK
jgi:hypothetical protein